ncbi:3-dehydroquinate synthase [Bifidobacterium actinocoloniiforme DSM 22766]|nr:3-dehydroquinate synthase [Bifidobacterium actinocoloniiforme DSM 22766]
MPGSGKTQVGRLAATITDLPFKDSDHEVERRAGRSIANIIEQDGEPRFRRVERQVVCRLLKSFDGGLLALSGGSPMTTDIYEELMDYRGRGGCIIYLDADPQEASARVARNSRRSLLARDPHERWKQLHHERAPIYESLATTTLPSHGSTPEAMAQSLAEALYERVVHISGAHPYDVRIGPGVSSRLRFLLGSQAVRVALIHTRSVQRHADHARALLRQAGYRVSEITIPDAEAGKTLQVADKTWDRLAQDGFTRSDAVVGVGGGAVADLAGFVAASWMQGIAYVNCPTSLLAMVDASAGGKSAINTAHGKNLIGAFRAPEGVLADLKTLKTLPREAFVEGLGETAKCGFIMDRSILSLLDDHADQLRAFTGEEPASWIEAVPAELIERSATVKARYVSVDMDETGPREFLSYGHTLGHAIEQVEHYTWRHGQAVAVGMVFAAELSRILGRCDQELVDLHRELLGRLGLKTAWSGGPWEKVLDAMRRDKKARGDRLRFVILEGVGRPVHLDDPPEQALREAFERIQE